MPTPTIPNGEEHFFPIIYEGNGAGQRVGRFVPFDDSSGGTIANSCIFNRSDNPKLERTPSGDGNKKTWTLSFWAKLGNLGTRRFPFSCETDTSNYFKFEITASNTIDIQDRVTASSNLRLITNRTFEDTSKYYHFMIAVDTTQSTASDRVKFYVDGDQVTSFSTGTYPSQDYDTAVNSSSFPNNVGIFDSIGSYDGYLSEFNLVDGQALLPASFGETDTSTGRWIPAQVKPHPTTTTTYTVTVVGGNPSNHPYYNVGSTNKFAINGSTATADVDLTLYEGATYRFDQSDSSNSGHPLRFSTVAHGTHASGGTEYTTNVTTVGTPGTSGAYSEITVASSAPDLHYYCSSHNGMGYQGSTPNGYGTNGFRLTFSDSSSLGADTSGNNHDFSVTNLVAGDQTTDSPTQNHATLQGTGGTLTEGNLTLDINSSQFAHHNATLKPKSGKYYAEFTCNAMGRSEVGVASTTKLPYSANNVRLPATDDGSLAGYMWYGYNGKIYTDSGNTNVGTYSTYTTNDIISIALDLDNLTVQFFKNNSSVGTFGLPNSNYTFCMGDGATGYSGGWTANFGQKSFTYTPPTGFVALQQDNLPETAKGVSGLVWIKNRDATDSWIWQDSLRGKSEYGSSASATQYNTAITDGVQKFLKGGVQIEDNDAVNTSGESYVAFNWVLNNGTNVTDTSGDLSTELQANPTAGVSVGKFTVSGSGNKTWAHGLGGVPEVGILCAHSSTNSGTFYHHKISTTPYSSGLFLINSNSAFTSSNIWGSAKPTSTLWTGLVGSLFSAGVSYIFYSFRGIEGFSKCGSYTGNGNANGTFVYTGFKPSFLMIKCTTHANNWVMYNNKMNPFNPVGENLGTLFPNRTNAAETQGGIDFCANGFKARSTYENFNGSGRTYVYMSFAEHPFVGDGTSPVTAR